MQISPITNCWGKVPTKAIRIRHSTVFGGSEGCSFNHQAQLTSANGILFASWSQGARDEDSPGQVPVLSVSEDRGRTWSPPSPIVPRQRGQFADRVMLNAGIRCDDGRLIAYYGDWELSSEVVDKDGRVKGIERGDSGLFAALQAAHGQRVPFLTARGHVNVVTRACISSDTGQTWSQPLDVIPRVAGYHAPKPTRSGRLIMPGNVTFPFTDDPAGLTGWRRAGLPRLDADFVDGLAGWFFGREARRDPVIYSEGSFFQMPDGLIRMMLRTETNRLAVSESSDDGETWSEPLITNYSDNIGRPHFGCLPDGRYFGLNCPSPTGHRTPAILALSNDGVVFDRHFVIGAEPSTGMRIDGYLKGGRYGYPWLHVDKEYGYVIYSVEKEDIAIGTFELDQLDN